MIIKNLPPLPTGQPFTPVAIAPTQDAVYDLQLHNGMSSWGTLSNGFMTIHNYHGRPQRMPVAWIGSFVKAWRIPHDQPTSPAGT